MICAPVCHVQTRKFKDPVEKKIYKTKKFGNQIWMIENLNTEHFANGEPIAEAKNIEEWQEYLRNNQPAWCYYNFETTNGKLYSKLYNFYAVNDPRGLAPKGWKIPRFQDWKGLEKYVNANYTYDGSINDLLISKTNWLNNQNGTNKTKFNIMPSGYVEVSSFEQMGKIAYFWSRNSDESIYFCKDEKNKEFQFGSCHDGFDGDGFAVRCLKE
jgi:uncharacterized protein (TIGR02145 family)